MKKIALLVIFLLSINCSGALAATPEIKAPCRLEVDNAHISKNILKFEARSAVKIVFRSICNVSQEKLVMKVQILKTGWLGSLPAGPLFQRNFHFVAANQIVELKNIYLICKNTKRTTYYGIATASAFVGGKKVYANKVESKLKISLLCGT